MLVLFQRVALSMVLVHLKLLGFPTQMMCWGVLWVSLGFFFKLVYVARQIWVLPKSKRRNPLKQLEENAYVLDAK